MSLYDIYLQRAAQEHQNMLNSDNAGLILPALAEGVAKGVQEEQARVQKQRDQERQNKQAIENYNKASGAIGSGRLIPKLTIKDDKYEFSASTPDASERKSQYELDKQIGFTQDVQSGLDAESLRVKYPNMTDDIDKLQVAGTVKSRGIPSSNQQNVAGVVPEGMVSKGADALGRPLGYIPKSSSDIKAEKDMAADVERKKLAGEQIVEKAKDTLDTIKTIKKRMNEFGLRGVTYDPPGWEARDWTNNVNKLKSQKIVDLIAEMKNVSKTGATGFGSLNKEELKVLQDASTALELGTPKEEAKVYLDNMEAAARKIINGSQKISTPQSLQPTDFQNFDKIPMPEFDAAQRIKNLKSKYGLN